MFPKPPKTEKKPKRPLKRVRGNTAGKKKAKADRLFSLLIRKPGRCAIEGLDKIQCNGGLQCMHIITRSNHRLRWDTANALPGCAGHHLYYTRNPWEWQELIKERFSANYEYINSVRNELWDRDIDKVLEGLEGVE